MNDRVRYEISQEQYNKLARGKRLLISLNEAGDTLDLEARTDTQLATLKKRLRTSVLNALYHGTMVARGDYQKSNSKNAQYILTEVHIS